MRSVPLQQAMPELPTLVEQAARGDGFVIAEDGKPLVKVVAAEEVPRPKPTGPRTGFLKGQIQVPDDFDTMFQDEIIAMFEGED